MGDDVPAPLFGVGTYSEYIILPQAAAIVVPSELPSDIACLIGCAVATGVGAVTNTADVRASDSAVVIGCGGVGLAIIMALSLVGATPIIAVDLAESRRELAVQAGATHALEGDDPELAAKVFGITGGADFAFDAIGLASTSASLPGLVRGGGAGVLVGMPRREAEVPFRTWELAAMNKRILGSNYGSTNARIDFPRIARMYLAGRLPLDLLVGAHRSIDDLDSAFADLKNSVGARTILDLGA